MMTPQTVKQLLQVFRSFRDNHRSGMPLHRAYHEGVRTVADAYSITYQTVGDGCRRRLGLNDISELYELLTAWVKGDPRGLVRQLKENSDPSSHAEIEQFFSGGDGPPAEIRRAQPQVSRSDSAEVFQFRLAESDARMLKALAELEGVSASELIARTIAAAVRDRMAVVARGIIKSAEARA
jgi:hypothetical protein